MFIYISIYLFVNHHAKRDLIGIEKSIDSGQPAPSAQMTAVETFRFFR